LGEPDRPDHPREAGRARDQSQPARRAGEDSTSVDAPGRVPSSRPARPLSPDPGDRGLRSAPPLPAGGSRLLLRARAEDRQPDRAAAPVPGRALPDLAVADRAGGPAPAAPIPVETMWPALPQRPPAPPGPGPLPAGLLTRWQRLTSEQAAT
jgi:hypothetical protein